MSLCVCLSINSSYDTYARVGFCAATKVTSCEAHKHQYVLIIYTAF